MYALVIVILQSTMRTRLLSPATLSAVVQLLCVFEWLMEYVHYRISHFHYPGVLCLISVFVDNVI